MQHKKWGFLNAFQLKLLMAFLMLLDHLYYNLFPETLGWAHIAARVVAPVFVYLMAEGMAYTRDRSRYIKRMLGFGFGMLAGSTLLHLAFGTLKITASLQENLSAACGELSSSTILISLGLSACVIHAVERALTGAGRWLWLLAGGGAFLLACFFEGSLMIPLMGLIFYFLRGNRPAMCVIYVLVFTAYFLQISHQYGYLPTQFYMVFAVLPILCYNGNRGPNHLFAKYFFYFFYPLHIWVIYIIWQTVR